MSWPIVQSMDENRESCVIRTLLLTDVVDSTKLVETYGDARVAQAQKRHDRLARDLLREFSGLEIDKTDGFLFLFERPLDAVLYSLAYHRALSEFSDEIGVAVQARAGIHLGEVILRKNDPEDVARGAKPLEVEGLAKHLAARVMSLALGNQTLITKSAFSLARRGVVGSERLPNDTVWMEHGLYSVKGIDDPVEICEIGVEGFSVLQPPPDSDKTKRFEGGEQDRTLGWRPMASLSVPGRASWKLSRRLGESEKGETWLVHQQGTGALHAFKFIFDAEHLRSLKREITLLRLIRDNLGERTDIARIYDVQLEDPPFYLEVDYSVDGTLEDWAEAKGDLQNTPLDTRLEMIAQLADALEAAHSIGIVHKAIRPSNVLVEQKRDRSVQVRLTDFAEGKLIDKTLLDSATEEDVTFSTLSRTQPVGEGEARLAELYTAPEVFAGEKQTPGSDIYSLGVLLYQLVVGDLHRPLVPGWEKSVEDPLLVEDIKLATRPNPNDRIGSAGDLSTSIRSIEKRREAERVAQESGAEALEARGEGKAPEQTGEAFAEGGGAAESAEEKIGDYTILRKIGEGGFGSVYLAENPITPGRQYAIKIFNPTQQGGNFTSSLSDELQHVLDLVHPFIVQIRGFGIAQRHDVEESYLVMDYIEGPNGGSFNLRNYTADCGGKIEESEVKRLFQQILSALCTVHQKMVAHLDIKPQNILLDRQYNAFISDFGISEAVHTASVAQNTVAAIKGVTPHYAAFEQIAFGQGSRRSDVYSLGVLILECLTGRRSETIPSAVNPKVEYAPPSAFGLSEGWDRILEKCLVHDPGERYENACELCAAVESLDLTGPIDVPVPVVESTEEPDPETPEPKTTRFRRIGAFVAWVEATTLGKWIVTGSVVALGLGLFLWGSGDGDLGDGGEDRIVAPGKIEPTPTPITETTGAIIAPATAGWTASPSPTRTLSLTNTPVPASPTPTNTPAPPSPTPTDTPAPPSPTPSATPIAPTATTIPSPTSTPSPSPTHTPMPPSPTPSPTPIAPTATATPSPTFTPSPSPTHTPMRPSPTPTSTATATNSPTPSATYSPTPSNIPTPTPTPTPSPTPPEVVTGKKIAKDLADRLVTDVFEAVRRNDKETFDALVSAEGGRRAWRRLVSLSVLNYKQEAKGPKTLDVDVRLSVTQGGRSFENTQQLRWTVELEEGLWTVIEWNRR